MDKVDVVAYEAPKVVRIGDAKEVLRGTRYGTMDDGGFFMNQKGMSVPLGTY